MSKSKEINKETAKELKIRSRILIRVSYRALEAEN